MPRRLPRPALKPPRETGLTVPAANLNSPAQTVISGAAGCRREEPRQSAKAKGARRAVMLPVSAPFHCALMQPAQEEVARVLASLAIGTIRAFPWPPT